MENSYNARCPAVKRLLREAGELHEATEEYFAQPLDDNLFEWHFTVRGPPDTEFDGGIYHGRIVMPAEYPMKPPNIIFFTPNGRFETNKKICLSISGHHPETWQPSWSIRTALLAIIGFMPTAANGTIGALDYTAEERAKLAKKSQEYTCCDCGKVADLLKERTGNNADIQQEAREVSAQMSVTAKPEDFSPLRDNETKSHAEDNPLPAEERVSENTVDFSTSSSVSGEVPSNNSFSPTPTVPSSVSSQSASFRGQRQTASNFSLSLLANNLILSGAVFLLVALVLRRLFLLEGETPDDVEDIVM